jgi:hypothetical protein
MVTLKLKVSNHSGEFLAVTSDMLEIVPSSGGVSWLNVAPHRLVIDPGRDMRIGCEALS